MAIPIGRLGLDPDDVLGRYEDAGDGKGDRHDGRVVEVGDPLKTVGAGQTAVAGIVTDIADPRAEPGLELIAHEVTVDHTGKTRARDLKTPEGVVSEGKAVATGVARVGPDVGQGPADQLIEIFTVAGRVLGERAVWLPAVGRRCDVPERPPVEVIEQVAVTE